MKFFIVSCLFYSALVLAECPRLEGNPALPPVVAALLPTNQLSCAQQFYHYQTAGEGGPHFCACFDTQNAMDQMAATTSISSEEEQKLKNLIEAMVVQHAKNSIETFFSNSVYFDAYVRRGALDTRLLANMDQCRLRGIVDKLKERTDNCNSATYARRLAKLMYTGSNDFDSSEFRAFENSVKKSLESEEGKETLFKDYIKNFQTRTIPLAKNIIPTSSPHACMPFKAYMMFSAPPIDDEVFDEILRMGGGLDTEREDKKHVLQNYLHLSEMGATYLQKVQHPHGHLLKEDSRMLEYSARIAANHPLMLQVFQNEELFAKMKQHIAQVDQCNSDQGDRYRQATDADYQRFYREKLAALTPTCDSKTGRELSRCQSKNESQAREFAQSKIPRQADWAKAHNEPRCENYKSFFQKEANINEIIKAQNEKCKNFRNNIGLEFLCKEDIANFHPQTLEQELGAKIFNVFGADGPRIFNHYLKKYYCSITPAGKGVPKRTIVLSKLEEMGVIDHLRPKSNLTDVRNGTESDYDRYNKFLCSKMHGVRPDGTSFSCDGPANHPPECHQSIYFKQMACQALKSELDGVTPALSEDEKRHYYLTPEEFGGVQHHQNFPSSHQSLANGAMILEFQRLANTLAGELGANCALPNPLPNDSTTMASWFATEETVADQGSGSSHGDNGAAFFSDYFLEGTPADEIHLVEYRTQNPGVVNGEMPFAASSLPYERRVEVRPVPQPTSVPTISPVASERVSEIKADPAISKLSGSLAERGIPYRVPAGVTPTPTMNFGPDLLPTPTPKVAPVATASPAPNPNDEARDRLAALEKKLEELRKKEVELEKERRRAEAERVRAEIERLKRERDDLNKSGSGSGQNTTNPTPTPTPTSQTITPTPIPVAKLPGSDGKGGGNKIGASVSKRTGARGESSSSRGGMNNQKADNRVRGKGKSSGSLDGFAARIKNTRYREPVEKYSGTPGGYPGIKLLKDHLPYEYPNIIPFELVERFGLMKVIMYFKLEGKSFSALNVISKNEFQIIVFAFNPSSLTKKQIESKVEVDRRLRIKRLLDEMRATEEDEIKNAAAFATAAENSHEIAREMLLNGSDRETALKNLLPENILDRAWIELTDFVVPRPDVE